MSRYLALLPALLLVTVSTLAQPTTQVLRVAVVSGRAAPFALWQGERAVGGVDVDLPRAIAAQLQWRVETVVLPRQRLRGSALAGEFDLVCGLDPARLPDAQIYHWSPSLVELPELLLGTRRAQPVDSLEQLAAGAEIGVLLGNVYPALEPAFADGRLSRAEAVDEDRLIRKLLADRHPYAVLAAGQPRATAELQATQQMQQLAGWRLPIGRLHYQCAAPVAGRLPVARLWEALEATRAQWPALLGDLLQPPLAVVVSSSSPLRSLDRHELVDLYLGRRSRLSGGETPRLTMLRGPERQQFLQQLLRREAADYQAAWASNQFGGRQRAPDEVADPQGLKARLRRDPLAIGYLPLAQVDAGLRVVYAP